MSSGFLKSSSDSGDFDSLFLSLVENNLVWCNVPFMELPEVIVSKNRSSVYPRFVEEDSVDCTLA